jgi:hypothetical protein
LLTQLEFFVSENFDIAMKNCQEMWLLYFSKNIEKSGMRTITRDMHESGNKRTCEFQPDIQKFLVTFDNENLFVNPAVKGHFSGYVRLPKNLRTTLCCDFCVDHRYRKNNKGRRAVSCEADEGLDSGSK